MSYTARERERELDRQHIRERECGGRVIERDREGECVPSREREAERQRERQRRVRQIHRDREREIETERERGQRYGERYAECDR